MTPRGTSVLCVLMAAGLLLPAALPLGAATPPPGEAPPVKLEIPEDPFAGLPERFRTLAQRDEQSKDWHRALMRWEAVAAIEGQDAEARRRISAIRKLLKSNAERHFQLAREALKANQHAKAFREFLRTLSYDPDNHLALTMVKYELNAKSLNEYKVKPGDTLREIAVAEYEDPEMTWLVQHFNGIRNPRDLKVGQVLKLPVMAGVMPAEAPATQVAATRSAPRRPAKAPAKPPPTAEAKPAPRARPKAQPEPEPKEPAPAVAKAEPEAPAAPAAGLGEAAAAVLSAGAAIVAAEVRQEPQGEPEYRADTSQRELARAQSQLDGGQYDAAAATAESVLEEDPANSEARALVNAAYYEQGQHLRQRQEYLAAMQVFTRVDPGYKDTAAVMKSLGGRLEGQQAEVHYIAGVTAFLEEDLDTAIAEWERTLEIDPNHPQAPRDLENARALRAKLAQVQ